MSTNIFLKPEGMVLILSGSGASAKAVWNELPLHFTQFLDCWFTSSSLQPVQPFLWPLAWNDLGAKRNLLQTNHPPNQPGGTTCSKYSHSSYWMPFVSPPVFLGAFCGTSQTISSWYGLEKFQDSFIKLDQVSDIVCSEELLHPCSGNTDEQKPGLQERMAVSVLSKIALPVRKEHEDLTYMSKNEVEVHM